MTISESGQLKKTAANRPVVNPLGMMRLYDGA
jgi:hypothetical protein